MSQRPSRFFNYSPRIRCYFIRLIWRWFVNHLKLFFEIKTDVEAAAELGRTLLERNRELESTVRQQQAVIDDQTQEMEVMKIKHM